jgi:2-polyprenyl-3-methyl-5-hydroxy-6-metoxy-1,4-benzoquinol methylase
MYKPHVRRLKRLYKKQRFVSLFMWLRWAKILRAPYKEIERLIPKDAKIIDIGCGYGFFTNFLALSGPKRRVMGIDISGERIKQAYKKLKNVEFISGNIMDLHIHDCDAVVIIHMLHHLPSFKMQEELLRSCFEKISHKGIILVGEIDTTPRWKSFLSKAVDYLLYWGDSFHFRSHQEFQSLLERIGFKDVTVINCDKGIPFAHKVLVGRKP